jgi:serine/threonine-protein kinase
MTGPPPPPADRARDAAAPPPAAGGQRPYQRVHKFELIERLGEGAMGVVWKAYDPMLRRYVALKMLPPTMGKTRAARDRFLTEGRAAAALQHPHIITVYDLGEAEQQLYIAMELVEGSDLSDLIAQRAPLALERKLDIVIDLLEGLHYAHLRGVIHRDIKPSNVRIAADGRVKLMDFGIARLHSADATDAAAIVGTPNYMAPEQITNGPVRPATDVFAAGGLLYELLTYRRPFEAESLQGILYRVLTQDPEPLRTLAPSIPASLERVVMKAMHKAPEDRYETAAKMRQALVGIRSALSDAAATTEQLDHAWTRLPLPLLRLLTHVPLRWRIATLSLLAVVVALLALLPVIAPSTGVTLPPPTLGSPSPSTPLLVQPGSVAPTGLNPVLAALRDSAERARDGAVAVGAAKNDVPAWIVGEMLFVAADSAAVHGALPRATQGWREAIQRYRAARGQADSLSRLSARVIARATATARALPAGPQRDAGAVALARAESLHAARDYVMAQLAAAQVAAAGREARLIEPTSQPADARAAVGVLLEDLARAVASARVANLRVLCTAMTDADAAAWQALFDRRDRITVSYRLGALRVSGRTATAEVDALYRLAPPGERLAREVRRAERMELARTDAGWRVRRVVVAE